MVLALEDTFYMLQYNADLVEAGLRQVAGGAELEEDGIEDAFIPIEEYTEHITSGIWVSSDCFVFANSKGVLSYLIGTKMLRLATADKKFFIIGYDGKQNRLYMIDKALNLTSYSLLLSLLNYQSAILNDDLHGAAAFFKDIPQAHHSKLAKFLEANEQRELAFEITPDQDHKFELAVYLNKIEEAAAIAQEQGSAEKFKKVGDIALMSGYFDLAEESFVQAEDFNSLLLFYSSIGDAEGLQKVVDKAQATGKYNVAVQAAYLLGDADRCLEILIKAKRVAEAAMFARAYAPSKIGKVMK